MYEKIVIVTRKTRLQELVERFNSRGQAKFYIEHAGGDFSDYVAEDDAYRRSLEALNRSLQIDMKVQRIDRGFVPSFLFTDKDLVVVVGQDGLVANAAKYVGAQPIVAVNPDPDRFDGVLLPFRPFQAKTAVTAVLDGRARMRSVTLAEASLNDGQRLLAFNDLFIGARTHVSARYRITYGKKTEPHSSSGVLVSTGAGSTGWLSSIFNMASGISEFSGKPRSKPVKMEWEDSRLVFVVREPYASKHSRAGIVAGLVAPGQDLVLESLMPMGGAIFSDGVETDFVAFNAGATARVQAARQKAHLVVR